MKIKFLGAARTVTGSCFLLTTKSANILIDCGMFQGVEVSDRNYNDFDFDPKKVNYVLLTHSHLDHCGLLPKLYKFGFNGKVITTPPTREIVEFMLLDSAKVQELQYREWKKQKRYKGWDVKENKDENLHQPFYETNHVLGLLNLIETTEFGKEVKINNDVSATFLRVGHALGAACIVVKVKEDGETKKLLFSGDIGNRSSKLDSMFQSEKGIDYIVMEALYGGRWHEKRTITVDKFTDSINRTMTKGGNVLIPAFTYQRSQEMLYLLKELFEKGRIPVDTRVYLDSPLAINITNIYKKYFRYLNPEVIKKYKSGEDLFSMSRLILSDSSKMSKRIRNSRKSIIIAGHGMCAGGRIIYHLLDNLEDKRATVIFVGFQAPGTLGNEIVSGAREVFIEDKKVRVKARIVYLSGFSAHADHDGLLSWLKRFDGSSIKKIFLVHSEEEMSMNFKNALPKYAVEIPEWKQEYEI